MDIRVRKKARSAQPDPTRPAWEANFLIFASPDGYEQVQAHKVTADTYPTTTLSQRFFCFFFACNI